MTLFIRLVGCFLIILGIISLDSRHTVPLVIRVVIALCCTGFICIFASATLR